MIAVIRIHGQIGLDKKKKEALERLMLKTKYSCVLLNDKELPKVLNIKDLVMFGKLDEKTLKMLLAARAKKDNKPLMSIPENIVTRLLGDGTTLRKEGLKPYINLHPPRGGFKKSTKLPYPRGILGKNEKLNEIILKML